MDKLEKETIDKLVGIHNGLSSDKPLKRWKGKKIDLVKRIRTLQKSITKKSEVRAKAKAAATKPVAKQRAKAPKKAKNSPTIRALAVDLLCEVAYYENPRMKSGPDNRVDKGRKTRSVGIPYDEILTAIHAEFKGCATTVACLRWYSVKIRVEELGYEGRRLPQRRPRAKSRKVS